MELFSEKLKRLRENKKISQTELAIQIYVSRSAVAKWEQARGFPNIDSLQIISKFFNVSVDDLISDKELKIMEVQCKKRVSIQKKIIIGLTSLFSSLITILITLSILYFPRTLSGVLPKEQITNIYILDSVNDEKIMIDKQSFDYLINGLTEIKYIPSYSASKSVSTYTFVLEYDDFSISINRSYFTIKNKKHYINVIDESLYELYLSFAK